MDSPEAIRALRAKLGLTQEGLARRLGVAVASVNRWECGHHRPTPYLRRALGDLAKCERPLNDVDTGT